MFPSSNYRNSMEERNKKEKESKGMRISRLILRRKIAENWKRGRVKRANRKRETRSSGGHNAKRTLQEKIKA